MLKIVRIKLVDIRRYINNINKEGLSQFGRIKNQKIILGVSKIFYLKKLGV